MSTGSTQYMKHLLCSLNIYGIVCVNYTLCDCFEFPDARQYHRPLGTFVKANDAHWQPMSGELHSTASVFTIHVVWESLCTRWKVVYGFSVNLCPDRTLSERSLMDDGLDTFLAVMVPVYYQGKHIYGRSEKANHNETKQRDQSPNYRTKCRTGIKDNMESIRAR